LLPSFPTRRSSDLSASAPPPVRVGGPARVPRTRDSSERGSRKLRDHGDVFVATTAQIDEDEIVGGSAALQHPRDGVGTLKCREDAFQPREGGECTQGLPISHGVIQYATRVLQVSVLRAHSGT